MHAPSNIQSSNFFISLPTDVRNLIGARLDGRSFARLGACSKLLRSYVLVAEVVWKAIHERQNYVGINPKGLWRDAVVLQGLVKRNMRADNIVAVCLDHVPFKYNAAVLCQNKVYVADEKNIRCYTKTGERLFHGVPTTEGTYKLKSLEPDLCVAYSSDSLFMFGRHTVSLRNCFKNAFYYDSNTFAYGDDEGTILSYDLKTFKERKIRDAHPDTNSLMAISEKLIIFLQEKKLRIVDLYKNQKSISTNPPVEYIESHFVNPTLVLNSGDVIRSFSFEWCLSFGHQKGTLVSDRQGIFLYHPNSNVVKNFTARGDTEVFAHTPGNCEKVILDGNRVILFSKTDKQSFVSIWNRQSKTPLFSFEIPGIGKNPFVRNNILFNDWTWLNYTYQFFDLSTGKKLGKLPEGVYDFHDADDNSMLCTWRNGGGVKYLYSLSFDKPLPPKGSLSKIGSWFL